MSELAVAALRMGLLLVMWILIISIVSSQGRDLMVGARNKVRARGKSPAPVAAGAAAGTAGIPDGGSSTTGTGGQNTGQQQTRPLPTRLQVTEGPLQGSIVELHGAPLLLGRAQEADLVLDDDYVSGRHARLFPQGSRWFLEDLGSTNGTYVSGSQLTRTVAVDPGTPIRIGKTVLELRA
ncbi:FHA domain-containing protein [Cellulosimicrobium funkei]|nr:FHA domain-containing protein [Cellulosimicrobium funkei]